MSPPSNKHLRSVARRQITRSDGQFSTVTTKSLISVHALTVVQSQVASMQPSPLKSDWQELLQSLAALPVRKSYLTTPNVNDYPQELQWSDDENLSDSNDPRAGLKDSIDTLCHVLCVPQNNWSSDVHTKYISVEPWQPTDHNSPPLHNELWDPPHPAEWGWNSMQSIIRHSHLLEEASESWGISWRPQRPLEAFQSAQKSWSTDQIRWYEPGDPVSELSSANAWVIYDTIAKAYCSGRDSHSLLGGVKLYNSKDSARVGIEEAVALSQDKAPRFVVLGVHIDVTHVPLPSHADSNLQALSAHVSKSGLQVELSDQASPAPLSAKKM